MSEFELLRSWLSEQSGKLNEISRQTGISRRTIQRIVNKDCYSPSLSTYSTLKKRMDGSPAAQAV